MALAMGGRTSKGLPIVAGNVVQADARCSLDCCFERLDVVVSSVQGFCCPFSVDRHGRLTQM